MSKFNSQHTNKDYFLKWLPFNFCDRHCERCKEFREDCKVYQEYVAYKLRCEADDKDPHDLDMVFNEVGETLARSLVMLEEKMEEEGIELTEEDEAKAVKEEERVRKKIEDHSLAIKTTEFIEEIRRFIRDLENFFEARGIFLSSIGRELKEIGYYGNLVSVKTYRALSSKLHDETERGGGWSDARVSGTLGYFSLLTCEESLKSILNLFEGLKKDGEEVDKWLKRLKKILKLASGTKDEFKKVFPDVEKSRDKIIFHGTLDF